MSYRIDMENIDHIVSATNFGVRLLRLVMKADRHNLALLRKAFPNAVETIEHWRNSETEETLDLPYD